MSQRAKAIRGRLEYEGWRLTRHPDTGEPGHCPLRLVLYDLPTGAVVTIKTCWERHRGSRASYRRLYAFRIPCWGTTLTQELDLETHGSLRVEVYRPTKLQPRPSASHSIEYRIDTRQQRPVRNNLAVKQLQLQLEEEFRRPESQVLLRCKMPELVLPPGSLFTALVYQGQEE